MPEPGEERAPNNLTYQPFLLVFALAALLAKVILSASAGTPLIDWLFGAVVLLCALALGVYIWDRPRVAHGKQEISITTGNASNSRITGVRAPATGPEQQSIVIKTKDVKGTEVTGADHTARGEK